MLVLSVRIGGTTKQFMFVNFSDEERFEMEIFDSSVEVKWLLLVSALAEWS